MEAARHSTSSNTTNNCNFFSSFSLSTAAIRGKPTHPMCFYRSQQALLLCMDGPRFDANRWAGPKTIPQLTT